MALFQQYNNGGAPLYDPNEMEAFEPTLFTQIINSIFNTSMSKDKKKIVAIMHILAYFRYIWHYFILHQHLLFYMVYMFYLIIIEIKYLMAVKKIKLM